MYLLHETSHCVKQNVICKSTALYLVPVGASGVVYVRLSLALGILYTLSSQGAAVLVFFLFFFWGGL